MDTDKIFLYDLPLTPRARAYFPSGVRSGQLLRYQQGDNWGIGEYAPLKNLATQVNDESHFLRQCAKYHIKIKQEPRAHFADAQLKLSALVWAREPEQAVEQAHELMAQGYTTLKIKIFNSNIHREIDKIYQIYRAPIKLRLDANRSLSYQQAAILCRAIQDLSVEYIEEPCANLSTCLELRDQFGIEFAVDESFMVNSDLLELEKNNIKYLIVKPTLFRDFFHVGALIQQARQLSITTILSPCFESEFTSALHALLAGELNLLEHAHGIYEPHFFAASFFPLGRLVKSGHLDLGAVYDALKNFDIEMNKDILCLT